jgi:hypothetical protein
MASESVSDSSATRDIAAQALFLRADSLMQRRRSFVAAPRAQVVVVADALADEVASSVADTPVTSETTPAADEGTATAAAPVPAVAIDEDDVPVLTEVVPPEAAPLALSAAAREEALAHRLAFDLAHAVGERLAAELPALIDSAWERVEDELRRGVRAIGERALKDFLASRQPSRPPPEPG